MNVNIILERRKGENNTLATVLCGINKYNKVISRYDSRVELTSVAVCVYFIE